MSPTCLVVSRRNSFAFLVPYPSENVSVEPGSIGKGGMGCASGFCLETRHTVRLTRMLRFLGLATKTVEDRRPRGLGRRRTSARPVLEPCEGRLLLSGLGGQAHSGPLIAERATAQPRVRFNGTLQGTIVNTPISPTTQFADLTYTGQASRPIGRFTGQGHHVVTVAAGGGASRILGTVEGTGTLTTADGSRIDYQGVGSIKAGRIPGSLTEEFRATVTGGTGRWAGLSGTFRVRFSAQSGAPGTPIGFNGRFNGLMIQHGV